MTSLFDCEGAKIRRQQKAYESEIDELRRQIGKLSAELEWAKKNPADNFTLRERRAMMEDSADSGLTMTDRARIVSTEAACTISLYRLTYATYSSSQG
ncbi:hypothetical protein FACS1894187_17680 [Synergistales bacterium]|nr:hypothetical protein FACS1894187_17680 [Synergistales bacterium]